MQHPGIIFMRLLAPLPLSWVRGMGWLLGQFLYLVIVPRRKVALVNLGLCFPQHSPAQRRQWARQSFVYFCQAWLDRAWLWHGKRSLVMERLKLTGAIEALKSDQPVILFVPHFYGLDAGGVALGLYCERPFCSIYTPQRNKAVDEWLKRGRTLYGQVKLFHRKDGVKPVIKEVRSGSMLYLLPDMNFGRSESVFVPFYGVPTATVPSLSRFARLVEGRIVPLVVRMTPQGYDAKLMPAWENFPTDDMSADTAQMNSRLQSYIDTMPAQYYWVHKRFKDRPEGEPSVY
jgi:KDO2-lipid IV(A) lauroyltransferase